MQSDETDSCVIKLSLNTLFLYKGMKPVRAQRCIKKSA